MCRMGLWLAPLMYVTCMENAGRWSCTLAHWNGTAEDISSDYESAARIFPRTMSPWLIFPRTMGPRLGRVGG